jgi:hypothetical protein
MGIVAILPYSVAGENAVADYGFTTGVLRFNSGGRPLHSTLKDGRYFFEDFNAGEDPLDVELTFSFRRCSAFFHGDCALGGPAAVLGVALFWESRTSAQRGVGSPVIFTADSEMNARCVAVHFERGTILGELRLTPKVFLVSPSPEEDPRFSRTSGAVLGALGDDILVSVDRSGGAFPISEYRDPSPSAALWRLHLDWSDPLLDSFARDHFEICINSAHRDYESIRIRADKTPSTEIPLVLKEILTASIFAFFTELKAAPDSWTSIINGECAPGSIGDLAWHFLNEGKWNTSSIPGLLADIRREFEM